MYLKIFQSEVSKCNRRIFLLSAKLSPNQLHFLYFNSDDNRIKNREPNRVKNLFREAMKRYGYESAMVSMIEMFKRNCITKEKFDLEYEIKNDENDINNEERDDLSVGEDLESLYSRIKNGEMTEERFSGDGEHKFSKLLCLLNEDERRKLERKDKDFLRTFAYNYFADVQPNEWKNTEFEHLKFSKSLADRRTAFIDIETPSKTYWGKDVFGIYLKENDIFDLIL